MNVGSDVIDVGRIVKDASNSGVDVRNVMTNISLCISLYFCLEVKG